MKIFDHKRKEFLPLQNVGWTFRDVVNNIYEGIEIVKPTGFEGLKYNVVAKDWDLREVYEYDIVSVILKSGTQEKIEGEIEWNEDTAQFLFRRFDNDNVVWMNGLYNICILESGLLI